MPIISPLVGLLQNSWNMIPCLCCGGMIWMVEKKAGQFSFADALVTVRASSDRLGKLSSVVKWY